MKLITNLAGSLTFAGGIGLSAIYFKAWKNKREYERILKDETFKDNTRPNYDSFGINWGFQADTMVHRLA